MAWYAQIGTDKVVQQMLFVADVYDLSWVQKVFGGVWVEAIENGGVQKNFPAPNFIYNSELNVFTPPKPFASWILNEDTCLWEAPINYPVDGVDYKWDEQAYQTDNTTGWVLV